MSVARDRPSLYRLKNKTAIAEKVSAQKKLAYGVKMEVKDEEEEPIQ